jgi:predicted 3-demethylubiquinone-9 3-methyltransferase (glyoxalase superfamily)
MQKIMPFLTFDNQAEEAMNFYISIFKNSKIVRVNYYGEAMPARKGSVMTCIFEIEGQEFYALNAGPLFTSSSVVSFFVNCETQEEVNELWEKLSAGGETMQCGWLKDKFGITWQIVPVVLGKMLNDPDPAKSQRVMKAMMQMIKLDIQLLQEAYEKK